MLIISNVFLLVIVILIEETQSRPSNVIVDKVDYLKLDTNYDEYYHIDTDSITKVDIDVSSHGNFNDEKLILISFDGFRWDYLDNYVLPNFNKYFLKRGVKISKGLRNAFSTVTFPNHWTLATGLYPESHGIVANVIYDSKLNETFHDLESQDNETKWFGQNEKAMPIWILNELKDENRKSGIAGRFPGANVPILNRTVTYSADYANELDWFKRVDVLISWLIDKEKQINFGTLYFSEPDETGHTYGPYSTNVENILYKCDLTIEYLIDRLVENELYDLTNIIITSDHGMETASFDKSIDLSDYVDITKFKAYGGLTQINIFPNDPKDEDEIYNSLKNIPHYNIYKKNEMPTRLNYKNNNRIGPLVMFGDVGYEIFKTNRSTFDWSKWKGDHGGDNQVDSMHPVFVASGPAFKKNYTTDTNTIINSVDVYLLMCFILDLKPAANNGSFEFIKNLLDENYLNRKLNLNNKDLPSNSAHLIRSSKNVMSKAKKLLKDNNLLLANVNYRLNNNYTNNVYIAILSFTLVVFILVLHFYSSKMSNKIFKYSSPTLEYSNRLDENNDRLI